MLQEQRTSGAAIVDTSSVEAVRVNIEGVPKNKTAEYWAKVVFHTFPISQGSNDTQQEIFQYISCLYPKWRMGDALRHQVEEALRPKVRAFLLDRNGIIRLDLHADKMSDGEDIDDESVEKQIEREPEDLQSALYNNGVVENNTERSRDRLISSIAQRMLYADETHFHHNGRPRQSSESRAENSSHYSDPWFSFICYYVLEGNLMGIEELDRMFTDIGQYLRSSAAVLLNSRVVELNKTYVEKHAGSDLKSEEFES